MEPRIVYYSAPSGNTRRFVERLGLPAARVDDDEALRALGEGPICLVTPTYSGRVPAPVARFLRTPEHRSRLAGVIAGGSTNFGADFGRAGKLVSSACGVPLLHTFELSGLPEDLEITRRQLESMCKSPHPSTT